MFTLAHLTDPHISPMPEPRSGELFGKRFVGYVNWRLRRKPRHDAGALAAIVRDIHAQKPDHIAVLGDLINIGLPAEYPRAAKFLERLGPAHDVSLVPGNHDSYVREVADTYYDAWRPYLTGDEPPRSAEERFPYVRRRGPVAIVGLSTALPTLPFLATGTLGRKQIERLKNILPALAKEDLFRVILIHHPPAGSRSPHKILTDASKFRAVIAEHGAELILHGHDHRHSHFEVDGPQGEVPLIGIVSASAPAHIVPPGAWNRYRIERGPDGWTCDQETRSVQPDGSVVATRTRRVVG